MNESVSIFYEIELDRLKAGMNSVLAFHRRWSQIVTGSRLNSDILLACRISGESL